MIWSRHGRTWLTLIKLVVSKRAGWLALALAALVFVGCGGKGGIKLSGKATLDGKPLEYASISFSPEDGQGQPVGGSIEEGEFTVTGVSLGKNRVKVTLAAEGESKPTHQRQRMQEIKDERKQANRGAPAAPKALKVKDLSVEITPGMPSLSLEFKSLPGGR